MPALYPGSFDPITNGHLDIIARAARLFGHVTVAVASNDSKSALFSAEERVELIRQSVHSIPHVDVVSFHGLLVDFAASLQSHVIVRGLRAVSDFEYEFQMALMNKSLEPELETVFLASREAFTYVSSRVIKEVARLGGDIRRHVPEPVAAALADRFGT
ncbi:MAG: Phosphopantetheine adenylyltransferase [Verrucomicrobiota bacterium]|jgi:pantetheine-phosphate adenylyltransferase